MLFVFIVCSLINDLEKIKLSNYEVIISNVACCILRILHFLFTYVNKEHVVNNCTHLLVRNSKQKQVKALFWIFTSHSRVTSYLRIYIFKCLCNLVLKFSTIFLSLEKDARGNIVISTLWEVLMLAPTKMFFFHLSIVLSLVSQMPVTLFCFCV